MKIAVFGASGKTGTEVVKQSIQAGYEVNAFVRDPAKMAIKDEKISLVQGDVLDPLAVEKAVEAVDVVVVALGPTGDSSGMPMTKGTQNIISAMKKFAVERLIVESSYPMSGSSESMTFLKTLMPEEKIAEFRSVIDDKIGQEKVISESGLSWTIIRPLMLTMEPKTGKYRVGEKLDVKAGDNISRADVADFILKEIKDNKWIGKTVTLSY